MSIQQSSGNPAQGNKPASKYTETDYRGVAASIDLASEIILRGKVPKEREQLALFDRSFHSNTMVMKAYRAVLQQAFEKPDSYLDPLLPFIQDAMDALPAVLTGPLDPYSPLPGKSEMRSTLKGQIREGRLQRLYQMRGDVEEWVRGTVAEVFETLEKHSFFSGMTGQQLTHATIALRFVYGEILTGLNPYVMPSIERLANEDVATFAGTAISEVRDAMMIETFRRVDEDPRLEGAVTDFIGLLVEVGRNRIQLGALNSRSQFDLVRSKVMRFEQNREQLAVAITEYCGWDLFTDYGLPHVAEFGRRPTGSPARTAFFIPGQVIFVEIPQDEGDAVIYGAFDTQSGTRSVAAACERTPNGAELGFGLSGFGLPERLAVGALHAAGMRLDDSGKIYPSWSHRLAPVPDPQVAEEVSGAVRLALSVQEHMLASLWGTEPELLKILSEDEATVICFEAGRVIVLGTCLPGNEARQAFFSSGDRVSATGYAARAKLDLGEPALWFARVLRAEEAPAPAPSGEELTAEQLRELDRRAFREEVGRRGAMNYRTFVSTLAKWDVLETNDGRGGHGSLKRMLDGSELRAGTWGKLRDPERNMNFARMYEILDRLRIPVSEYTHWLSENR
jgi:hypothetical protein